MRRQAAHADDRKDCASQTSARFRVRLNNANLPLHGDIRHAALHGFVHDDGHFFAPQAVHIADGRFMLLDHVVADQQTFGHCHAVVVRQHGGHQVARAAVLIQGVDVEANARNGMTVQCIRFDDPNPAGRILIDHRRQNLHKVLISAVNAHLPFSGGRMIAVRRLNFPDGISAVPQFREGQMAAGIGSLLLHERVAGIVNAEHSAGQRLAVLLDLFQLNLVDFIPNFGFPDDFSFACHREGFYRHIQRIPLRRIGFLERIRSGNKRNVRQLTVFIRIRAVNGAALRIVHFNQRTGQRFLAGNVPLGNRHRRVNQAIQDRRIQRDCDCLLRFIHVFGCQQHRVLFGIQQPAIRRGQFLDIIRTMRIHAGEGQIALGIRDSSRHQRMGRQLLVVAVGNHPCIEQAEHTALAGNCLDG